MRKFQNLQTQKFHDKSNAKSLEGETQVDGAAASARGETSHENVVAEHGKAHTINIKHDHEAGHHHVHSVHESGHEHHADFGSAEEAHEHAKKMAGVGEHEELEDEAANKLEEAGHGDSAGEKYRMPGLD